MPTLSKEITALIMPAVRARLDSLQTEAEELTKLLAGKRLNGHNGHTVVGAELHMMDTVAKKRKTHKRAKTQKAKSARGHYVARVWEARKALGLNGKMKKSESKKVRAWIATKYPKAEASANA